MHMHAKPKPVSGNAVSTRPQRSSVASKEDAPASTVTVDVNLAKNDHEVHTQTAIFFMPTSAVARERGLCSSSIIPNTSQEKKLFLSLVTKRIPARFSGPARGKQFNYDHQGWAHTGRDGVGAWLWS
jgi:hypothetical protein